MRTMLKLNTHKIKDTWRNVAYWAFFSVP